MQESLNEGLLVKFKKINKNKWQIESLKSNHEIHKHFVSIDFERYVLKRNAQFFQKVTFEPLMDLKQNHYGNWKCFKSCYF